MQAKYIMSRSFISHRRYNKVERVESSTRSKHSKPTFESLQRLGYKPHQIEAILASI